jgi:alkylhydroperoxidase/carboxymuconolactone decarboxylase family protein YurZ
MSASVWRRRSTERRICTSGLGRSTRASSTTACFRSPNCEPQLEVHVNAALNVGLAPEEIVEALLHSAVYCGMPKALNATFVAKKVFADRDVLPIVSD